MEVCRVCEDAGRPHPPPSWRGVGIVHGRSVLAAGLGITVELIDLLRYPAGVELRLALTAYGHAAQQARYETRPLTDPPGDPSPRWSFLRTHVRAGDLTGEADPYQAPPILSTGTTRLIDFRTTPRYWIDGIPRAGVAYGDRGMGPDRTGGNVVDHRDRTRTPRPPLVGRRQAVWWHSRQVPIQRASARCTFAEAVLPSLFWRQSDQSQGGKRWAAAVTRVAWWCLSSQVGSP